MPTKIDFDCCIACGTCIEVCPEEVYDEDDEGKPVNARPEDCTDCGICVSECPEECIELV
ncbi:MAG: 4Fe-4S dicluster domain-containing protein [Candidatus Heimdallarchaeota archaeon]|nr:4Fe-4S dicluster domain-containing protein [Candidatus Heimdallarchaeota archaeon]